MLDLIGHQLYAQSARRFLRLANRFGGREPTQYYFGYGANLNTDRFKKAQMKVYDVGIAKLENHVLNFELQTQFKGLGYASVAHEEGKTVFGFLCQLDTLSLHVLDIMEFVPLGVYERVSKTVETMDGKKFIANVLVAKKPVKNLKPSKRYLDIVVQGAIEKEFSDDYLEHIRSFGSIEHPEIDPMFTLWTADRKRHFYRRLAPLYAKHDAMRERILSFLRSFDS